MKNSTILDHMKHVKKTRGHKKQQEQQSANYLLEDCQKKQILIEESDALPLKKPKLSLTYEQNTCSSLTESVPAIQISSKTQKLIDNIIKKKQTEELAQKESDKVKKLRE